MQPSVWKKYLILKWNFFWFRPSSYYTLLLFRFLIFFIGSIYLFNIPVHHPSSFYQTWDPISFYTFLSGPLSFSTLSIIKKSWLILSVLAGLNICFRWTGKTAAFCGLFYFGYHYNFGHVYHGTHLYIMIALILSFSKILKHTEFDSEHRWPIAFSMMYVSYMMFFCGIQKMYYGDGLQWALSESFYLRIFTNPSTPFLNDWIVQSPLWISQTMAFWGLVITEVLTPLYLFHKKTRYLAFFIWTGFHIMVMLVFGSHKSFVTQVLCYFAILPMEDWTVWIKPYGKKIMSLSA